MLLRFLLGPGVCPDDAAHFFHVQMFRERRSGRDGEKGKEAIQIIGRRWNQFPIPFHYVGCFAQFVEHWPAIDRVDRVQLERERRDDSEISATAAKRPEQVRVLISAGFNKISVGQYDIG